MFHISKKQLIDFIVNTLLEQIKARRIALLLKQQDMMMRVGISRQQYQRLESKGNPRLNTLELVAKGLNSELLLVPREKLSAVMDVLAEDTAISTETKSSVQPSLSDDPWQGLLGDKE